MQRSPVLEASTDIDTQLHLGTVLDELAADLFNLDVQTMPAADMAGYAASDDCTNNGCTNTCNSCGCTATCRNC